MEIQRTCKYVSVSLVLIVISTFTTGALGAKLSEPIRRPIAAESSPNNAAIYDAYGNMPLFFTPNEGQCDKKVKFYERSGNHATYFTEESIFLFTFKKKHNSIAHGQGLEDRTHQNPSKETNQDFIKLSFLNPSKNLQVEAIEKKVGRVNTFLGNDSSKWRSNLPTYKYVLYKNVYEGIDIKFYGNNRQLEFDIIVGPEADPSAVTLAYEGMNRVKIMKNKDLEFVLDGGKILQKRPYIYQEINGKRIEIQGYLVIADNFYQGRPVRQNLSANDFQLEHNKIMLKVELAKYDAKYPLIIDPLLSYSSYLGGNAGDHGSDITVDAAGNAYIVGSTYSPDFPTDTTIYPSHRGGWDAFITKMNSSGSDIIYSTYIGGSGSSGSGDGDDYGQSIAIDNDGNAYITGRTQSYNFPVVSPIQLAKASFMTDAFVTKINANGSAILFSTFLGGTQYEASEGIALDNNKNIYITGYTGSTDYPTQLPYQANNASGRDVFVTKINGTSLSLAYSTYIGGNNADEAWDIAVDNAGNAYITGDTYSTNFPTAPVAGTRQGNYDAFVTSLNSAGSGLNYSVYLGGSGEEAGFSIAVDGDHKAYVTGTTNSSNFPVWPTGLCQIGINCPYQSDYGGGLWDAFVTVINPDGQTLTYSTYIGGDGIDKGVGIAVDKYNDAYVVGDTNSSDFPTVNPIQATFAGGLNDAFALKINSTGTALIYSTYLGGSDDILEGASGVAVDSAGAAYVTGVTYSSDFPVWPGVPCAVGVSCPFQMTYQGNGDGWVAKIGNPPFNDVALAAPPVMVGLHEGSLYGATNDGSASCGSSTDSPDVWYAYTASAPGTLLADTCGTNDMSGTDAGIDTVLSLHTETPGTDANEAACDDDWDITAPNACGDMDSGLHRDSVVAYEMVDGETVYARVSRYSASEDGPFLFNLDFICAGDFEPDVDIDGSDLAYYGSHATGIALNDFAANFGKSICP